MGGTTKRGRDRIFKVQWGKQRGDTIFDFNLVGGGGENYVNMSTSQVKKAKKCEAHTTA